MIHGRFRAQTEPVLPGLVVVDAGLDVIQQVLGDADGPSARRAPREVLPACCHGP